jgi:phospholipase C
MMPNRGKSHLVQGVPVRTKCPGTWTISPSAYHTQSPIKHVVIIGENRGFDHVFATYVAQQCNKLKLRGYFKDPIF